MSWNKTHSKALEEKVARLKNANHRIREELKQCYKKIAELEGAMKHKECEGCKYNTDNKPRCFKYNDCFREQTRETKQDRYEPKDKR